MQKILTDTRRQTQDIPPQRYTFDTISTTPNIEKAKSSSFQPTASIVSGNRILTADYHYLSTDLIKTVLFTGILVVLELGLYYMTKST